MPRFILPSLCSPSLSFSLSLSLTLNDIPPLSHSVITDGFLVRGHKIQHRIYVCDPSKPNQKHFMKRVGSTTHITTTGE